MRRDRPDPLPRRRSDRVEDAVVWALALASLLLLAVAIVAALVVHGQLAEKSAVQQTDRTPVTAVVTAPVPAGAAPGALTTATVSWTGADGRTHTDQAYVAGRHPAGDSVQVWVSRDGTVIDPPLTATDATFVAWVAGLTVLMLGGSLLGIVGWAAMRWVWSLHAATWEREWQKVEPEWRLPR